MGWSTLRAASAPTRPRWSSPAVHTRLHERDQGHSKHSASAGPSPPPTPAWLKCARGSVSASSGERVGGCHRRSPAIVDALVPANGLASRQTRNWRFRVVWWFLAALRGDAPRGRSPSRTDRASAFCVREVLEVLMTTGTIKKVVADRGFGFISAEDDEGILLPSRRPRLPRSISTALSAASASSSSRAEPQGPARQQRALRLAVSSGPPPAGRSSDLRTAVAPSRPPRPPDSGTCPLPERLSERPSRLRTGVRRSIERTYVIVTDRVRFQLSAAPVRHRDVHPRPGGRDGRPRDRRPAPTRARHAVPPRGPSPDPPRRARRLRRDRRGARRLRRGRLDPARLRHLGRRRRRVRLRLRAAPSRSRPSPRSTPILADADATTSATILVGPGRERRRDGRDVQVGGARARERLRRRPARLDVIPHGVPDLPLGRARRDQGVARPRRARRDPELRPAGSRPRATSSCSRRCRRSSPRTRTSATSSSARRTRTCSGATARRIATRWSPGSSGSR